jgi:eukaryotic-like serine/threonine-protein kinase
MLEYDSGKVPGSNSGKELGIISGKNPGNTLGYDSGKVPGSDSGKQSGII